MMDTTPGTVRTADLRLARLHLRLGSLTLARAELEALAGSGDLDDDGLVDLAEARWRTGDLAGAGEAAGVALEAGAEVLTALVVAAEASAQAGRTAEARRQASRALDVAGGAIDDVFAGMPRASIWPGDPGREPSAPVPLFDPDVTTDRIAVTSGTRAGHQRAPVPGLWDETAATDVALPDPDTAFASGRVSLRAGDAAAAALHLALVLRIAPAMAPRILELIESADGPEMAVVRGDAYRLAGHERDARIAFARAAAAIPEPPDVETDKETP